MRITPIQIQITPVQPYRPVYRGNSPVQYADLLNRISGYRENGRPKIWALTQSEIFEILRKLVDVCPDEIVKIWKLKTKTEDGLGAGYIQDINYAEFNNILKNVPDTLADIYFSKGILGYKNKEINDRMSLFKRLIIAEERLKDSFGIRKVEENSLNSGNFSLYRRLVERETSFLRSFIEIIQSCPDLIDEAKKQINELDDKNMAAKALNMISKLGNMKKKENDDIVFNRIFRSNNFLHQTADFIPNENNKDLYKRIIDRVKNMHNVDFNVKDSMDISFVEKVFNSENETLLDLIKDKELKYYKELDWAYENIQNESFKQKAKNLNFVFDDIVQAVKLSSRRALDIAAEQFKSPLYSKDKQGEKLAKMADSASSSFTAYFFARYSSFLPEYTKDMIPYYAALSRNDEI